VSNELSIDIRFALRQTIIRFSLSFLDTTASLGGLLLRRLMLCEVAALATCIAYCKHGVCAVY